MLFCKNANLISDEAMDEKITKWYNVAQLNNTRKQQGDQIQKEKSLDSYTTKRQEVVFQLCLDLVS